MNTYAWLYLTKSIGNRVLIWLCNLNAAAEIHKMVTLSVATSKEISVMFIYLLLILNVVDGLQPKVLLLDFQYILRWGIINLF